MLAGDKGQAAWQLAGNGMPSACSPGWGWLSCVGPAAESGADGPCHRAGSVLLHGEVTSLGGTWDRGMGAHTLETDSAPGVAELCGHMAEDNAATSTCRGLTPVGS